MRDMLLGDIKRKALRMIREDFRVLDFSFGLPYTYVAVEGERGKALGVMMTLPEEIQVFRNSIKEISVEAFMEKADSLNIIERTLALAAINAVSQYYVDLSGAGERDVLELLNGKIKRVAVIGNMPPIVRALKERGFEVYVFERNPRISDRETFSDSLEYILLPQMDAVIVSGSSLANGTLEMILERSKNAELIALTGPSAQVHPELIEGTGITHLASMKVLDVEEAITKLKLGCFRGFEKANRKYTIKVKK